jgi:hypothetical protein
MGWKYEEPRILTDLSFRLAIVYMDFLSHNNHKPSSEPTQLEAKQRRASVLSALSAPVGAETNGQPKGGRAARRLQPQNPEKLSRHPVRA